MDTSPDQLIQRLLTLGIIEESDLQPCSDLDIRELEQMHGVILPAPYKCFLRRMGRGAGDFLRDDHWAAFYDSLPTLNSDVREHLKHVSLTEKWFCFATRMGECDLFFMADGSDDDPPVYYWSEGTGAKTEIRFSSFWDWIREMVEYYEQYSG